MESIVEPNNYVIKKIKVDNGLGALVDKLICSARGGRGDSTRIRPDLFTKLERFIGVENVPEGSPVSIKNVS